MPSMKILAVSDQVVERLYSLVPQGHFTGVEMILGCGDLPYSYLEFMVSMLNVPIFYVPGNHDPAHNGRFALRFLGHDVAGHALHAHLEHVARDHRGAAPAEAEIHPEHSLVLTLVAVAAIEFSRTVRLDRLPRLDRDRRPDGARTRSHLGHGPKESDQTQDGCAEENPIHPQVLSDQAGNDRPENHSEGIDGLEKAHGGGANLLAHILYA